MDKLLERQIISFVTFYHWDLPQALEDKGGWRSKDTSYTFADYVKVVVDCLSDHVRNWMTLNEGPCVVMGYETGEHAPGVKEPENGCSFGDVLSNDGKVHDDYRINYLKEHLIFCS